MNTVRTVSYTNYSDQVHSANRKLYKLGNMTIDCVPRCTFKLYIILFYLLQKFQIACGDRVS